MQGCITYIQPSQGCMHLAKDDHKVVCTLQMLMQTCHKVATKLPQPRNVYVIDPGRLCQHNLKHDR